MPVGLAGNELLEFILRLLSLCSKYDIESSLFYRLDGEHAPVTFWINCSDVFWWGTADGEEINKDNIDFLEEAIWDVKNICGWEHANDGIDLFCARIRKMRPQGAVYKHYPKEIHHLFNTCGPEREVGLGNPVSV